MLAIMYATATLLLLEYDTLLYLSHPIYEEVLAFCSYLHENNTQVSFFNCCSCPMSCLLRTYVGGCDAKRGVNTLISADGRETILPGKTTVEVKAGVRIFKPAGTT